MKKYICTDQKFLLFVVLSDIDNFLAVNNYINPYLYAYETDLSSQFLITKDSKFNLTKYSDNYSYNENIIYIKDGNMIGLKRIILDLYARLLEQKYLCNFYHASAFDKNGAKVFVGDRGSGKTYNMIQGIINGGNFIANDKITIIDHSVIGFPTSIGIRRKNLLIFDKYREQFKNDSSLQQIEQEQNDTYDKISFNVSDFCKLFDCGISPTAKLDEIIYLSNVDLDEYKIDSVYEEQSFIKKMIKVRRK